MTLKLYEIEFVEELEFENKKWIKANAAMEASYGRAIARIEQLEKINYNLTRDNIEQANKLAALKGDT